MNTPSEVSYARTREIVMIWAEEHGLTQKDVLNLALIRRTAFTARDLPGHLDFIDRLHVVTGHEELKLNQGDCQRLQEKSTATGVDYGLRRKIAEFLYQQWSRSGLLPTEEQTLNLPADRSRSIDDVIRHIRHSEAFQRFLAEDSGQTSRPVYVEKDGDREVETSSETVSSGLMKVALPQIISLTMLLDFLLEEEPEVARLLAKTIEVRGLAQRMNVMMSPDPPASYQNYKRNQGRVWQAPH